MSSLNARAGSSAPNTAVPATNTDAPDCAHGAIPPVGECYGLEMIVDESVEAQPDVYLEGGDHASLVHMDRTQFARLMADARHGRFSVHD